jgi:hypothetical protein
LQELFWLERLTSKDLFQTSCDWQGAKFKQAFSSASFAVSPSAMSLATLTKEIGKQHGAISAALAAFLDFQNMH